MIWIAIILVGGFGWKNIFYDGASVNEIKQNKIVVTNESDQLISDYSKNNNETNSINVSEPLEQAELGGTGLKSYIQAKGLSSVELYTKDYNFKDKKLHELFLLADARTGINIIPLVEEIALLVSEDLTDLDLVIESLNNYRLKNDSDVNRVVRGIQTDLLKLREWSNSDVINHEDMRLDYMMLSIGEKPRLDFIGHPEKLVPIEYLKAQIVNYTNAEARLNAVKELSLQRSNEITELLLSASKDSNDKVRLYAFEALMHAAAVGFDVNGRVIDEFYYALNDPNEDIAELAEIAIEQLSKISN